MLSSQITTSFPMCVFKREMQSQFQYFRCTTELSVPIGSIYNSVVSVYFTDKTWYQSWHSYIRARAGFSSSLGITCRLTNCPIVAVLLYRWWMKESEGTCSDLFGLGSQGYHPGRKKGLISFSLHAYIFYQMFQWPANCLSSLWSSIFSG